MYPDRFTTAPEDFAGVALVGTSMSNLVRKMSQDILAQVTIYNLNGLTVCPVLHHTRP